MRAFTDIPCGTISKNSLATDGDHTCSWLTKMAMPDFNNIEVYIAPDKTLKYYSASHHNACQLFMFVRGFVDHKLQLIIARPFAAPPAANLRFYICIADPRSHSAPIRIQRRRLMTDIVPELVRCGGGVHCPLA